MTPEQITAVKADHDKMIAAKDAGYLGMLPDGCLVDRREYPDAMPVQANEVLQCSPPKENN